MMMLLATIALALAMPTAPVKKVLVIGVDGCRPDALSRATTPYIDSLVRNGCLAVGKADPLTLSGPCWSTVLCGVWAVKHGVTDNGFVGANFKEYPDFLTLVEGYKPSMRTVAVAEWKPVLDQIVQKADYEGRSSGEGDEATALEAASQITDTDPDVVFVHFGAVDTAGHAFGYGPSVPQYLRAIEATDKNVGLLLAAVQSRKRILDEDWLVILTSDHGGSGTSHGQAIPEHINVPFIVSGPSSADGFDVIPALVDVAPTVFAHLGIVPRGEVDWDGIPVGLRSIDSRVLAQARERASIKFYPERHFLFNDLELEMSVAESEAEIRYSTDGSFPYKSSNSWGSVKINLTQNTLIRARAYRDRRPIGPSVVALYKVQREPLRATQLTNPSMGLKFVVVEGRFIGLDGIDYAVPLRSGTSGGISAGASGLKENFAVKFEGFVLANDGAVFEFLLSSHDGSRLWIDDVLLVDNDGVHSTRVVREYAHLEKGWHKIRIEYFQSTGDAHLALMWRSRLDQEPEGISFKQLANKG